MGSESYFVDGAGAAAEVVPVSPATILADRIRPGSGLVFRPLLAGKTRTPCHVRRCGRKGIALEENHSAHTEREESGQSEDAQREQPREPGEGNALNPSIRLKALTG